MCICTHPQHSYNSVRTIPQFDLDVAKSACFGPRQEKRSGNELLGEVCVL